MAFLNYFSKFSEVENIIILSPVSRIVPMSVVSALVGPSIAVAVRENLDTE